MSTDMQNEMSTAVAKFVDEITEIAKQAARDQLDVALGSFSGRGGANSRTTTTNRAKGVKRDPGDIEKIGTRFYEFVKANPGLRIEQINAKLGTSTKDLRLPIKKMLEEGNIKMKGKKRSTTYMAAA
jgi:hypothetical protein